MPDMQAYQYEGPEAQHAVIGQIMAYLGYAGGHEQNEIGAYVMLREENGNIVLSCDFEKDGVCRHFEDVLPSSSSDRSNIKNCLLRWHAQYTGGSPNPWGTLIGVRPTKLVHHLFDTGLDDDGATTALMQRYQVDPETAQRLVQMARLQRPYVTHIGNSVALYIGIPYCPSHCMYCSFPSRLVGGEKLEALHAFASAVCEDLLDIKKLCRQYGLAVQTIYMGGGTPTCLSYDVLERILYAVSDSFGLVDEWTVEAGRPDTASIDKLELLRRYGVDRISVNPQTMQQRILDEVGRCHRVEDIYTMYRACRQMGFKVVNMDFIAGLPDQTEKDMQENMEIVCQLHPENVTIHTLALKKKAPLFHHPLRQQIPSSEKAAQMLEFCRTSLRDDGYIPYYMYRQTYMAANFANVGYALPDAIGVYNIQMMEERQTVLAAGPGGANKFAAAGQKLEKVYMPKEIDTYMNTLHQKMQQRRRLCGIIYGGEDR